jgi:hypothetical protein
MNDNDTIRRVEDNSNAEYRSASTNALIGLAAAKLAEPYVKDGYKKLKDKKKK